MKIAICSAGLSEFSITSIKLGKCPNFVIYNHEDLSFTTVENKSRLDEHQNGPNAVRELKKLGVEAIITTNIGKNAFNQARIMNIPVFKSDEGEIVRDVIYKYFKNELIQLEQFNKDSGISTVSSR